MKNSLFFKAILFILCFCMAFSVVGCQKSGEDNVSSNNSSTESTPSDETPSDDQIVDENTPQDGYDDTITDDFTNDDWNTDIDTGVDQPFEMAFDEVVDVKNGSKPVEDDFLGFNGVYHCYTYMKDSDGRNYTEEQAQTEFNRLQNMGVSIVRTYYNQEFSYNKETGVFDWESENMQATYKWMKEMQKRNISVALNAGWSMRGAYVKDYYAPWLGCYVEGDLEASAKNHANFVSESLKQFRAHGINNIEYLVLFTEPGGYGDLTQEQKAKIAETPIEDTYDLDPNVHRWLTCSRAIHDVLVKDGTRNLYQLVGPNTSSGIKTKNPDTRMEPLYYFALKYASDYVDIYSHHRYPLISDMAMNTITYVMDNDIMMQENIDKAHNLGKKFWYDETGMTNGSSGLIGYNKDYFAEGLHEAAYFSDTMNRGVQALLWWYIFDQQWPNNHTTNTDNYVNGLHGCGFVPSLLESYIPQYAYYGNSLLTKYFGNNAKVYTAEAILLNAAAQQDKNGDWSLCAVNMELENCYIEFNFEKNIGKQKFYRHVYSTDTAIPTVDAEIIPADKIITTNGDKLVDKIPPNCSVVYTTIKD